MKKRKKILTLLLTTVLMGNAFSTIVYAEGEEPLVNQTAETEETDQVIVTFKEEVKSELGDFDVVKMETINNEEIVTVKVPEGETVAAYTDELEERKDVKRVEPDYFIYLTHTPNDPYYGYYQYHHQNIESESAWGKTMGSPGVTVAVLDQGFDLNHRDLVNRFVSPYSTVTDSYSGLSVNDHGTHVAGIIGSSVDNYFLGAGVAPETSIMPIDVFDGERAYTSDVIEGIYHAVAAGADIINMSIGSYNYNYYYDNAIQYAYQSGLVIVASAGNDSTTQTHYPSSYDNVISVGSTDSSNFSSYFSNYGYDIDIVAPGSGIYSTLSYDNFGSMSGTSMAAPVVSGVAALVLANQPSLTNDEVVDRLLTTAKDIGNPGKDFLYGNGLVNSKQALKITDIPSPIAYDIYDYSTGVFGYLPFDMENGKIMIRDNSGTVIASDEGYSGYTYFNIAVPLQTVGTQLYVSVMDSYGNESEAAVISVLDGTAPLKPDVDEITDQSTRITGGAEPNAKVMVSENATIIYNSKVDGNGFINIPITKMKAGTKLSLTVSDTAGNISEATEVTVKDATAPAKPKVNEVTEASTEVKGTAEAESIVSVKSKGVLLGEAAATADGKYTIGISKQKAGTLLTVYSTDQAGNTSESVEVTVKDLEAPSAPVVDKVTDKMEKVTGTAEATATVSVKVGGTQIGSGISDADGKFNITIPKQKAGTILSVTAVDSSGNSSMAKEIKVEDATAPASPAVNKVTDQSASVTGSAEAGATITVKVGATRLGAAAVGSDGKFTVTVEKQKVGTELEITATDKAGNVSSKKVVVVLDGTPPNAPTVDKVTDKSTAVIGTGEASAFVSIKAAGTEVGAGKVANDGKFEVVIARQQARTKLQVTLSDAAGNISAPKEIIVEDETAPSMPTVNKVTDQSTTVAGTAEAGSRISIKLGNNEISAATVSADGKYLATIAKQKAGTVLAITATDKVGKVSGVKEITVVDGTAPAVSLTSKVTNHSTRIIGTAEAGAKIEVKTGTKLIGTTTADAKDKYEIKIPKQKVGVKLSITASDAGGNTSKALALTVVDGNYSDLKVSHWALDEIMYLADGMIIGGYPNGSFQPEKNTTRAEAAKMLALALELPIESAAAGYKDVSSKHWAKDYIAAVSKAGLFNGNPDGTFEPDDMLTRAEMAKVISIAYGLEASSVNPFKDVKNGHWAKGYISGLYENGITTGYSDRTFLPEKPTTRAEYSVFLARALNKDFR